MLKRLSGALAGALALAAVAAPALAQKAQHLRIAMTASDLPTTTGMPTNGGEGLRFVGYPIFESLTEWNLQTGKDKRAQLQPGLATEWASNPEDRRKWVFKLRQGIKFHDGSEFDADAVIWNIDRFWDEKSPQFEAAASGIARARLPHLAKWYKIDKYTVGMDTFEPVSFFPYTVAGLLIASPAQWEKLGKKWDEVAKSPSGTGPFKITKVTPRVSIELGKNAEYWNKDRIPKLDRITLFPMPEANTRLAALRSGQVDWIEVPPPDSIPSLKSAGFQISLKPYPHIWPYFLSTLPGTPFADKRVRQAANYAIDRQGLVQLLNGTARAAVGFVPPDDVTFGKNKGYSYDPAKAKALLKEAGYDTSKPAKVKIMISTSGSGQMMPIPMNELIQQNLEAVGFKVEFDVVEWGTMLLGFRQAPDSAVNKGRDAMNISLSYPEPSVWYRYFHTKGKTPTASNWGHWSNAEFDAILDKVAVTFDPAEVDKLLQQANDILIEEAPWVYIVHDLNPRAMTTKVKGFEPAQAWFQDLTPVYMD